MNTTRQKVTAVGLLVLAAALAAGASATVKERDIPQSQGTNVAPNGDTITITSKCLRWNGVPKVPVMGEMHYARVPENEWRDYVRKMKDGGLTVLATYVFWVHHEEKEGQFDFTGRRDIGKFLSVCEEEKMPVVLRIGPWDHGECIDGGFPRWLIDRLGAETKRLRSLDPDYMACVERFWTRLFQEVDGHLFKQGGAVIGCQLENECHGPWPYFVALKALARKIGFDVPFYTRTGWPAMQGRAAYGEILPLFGDYADGFWERKQEPSPNNYLRAYAFSNVRASANIATEQLPQSLVDEAATAQYPYFTCELGGGMPSAYHRRVRVTPMDTYAMALVRLGSGSNLLGYYMYAGGTNPNRPQEGVFFNECQQSPYTNHNDLPPFSYEFYGPISEFGETTAAYELLKPLHKFCANFAEDFALADPEIVDAHNARRGPFLFHNDYVRIKATAAIPYIFPENWKTKKGVIKSATVQPVEWEGDTLILMKIPGIEPRVIFEGEPFDVKFVDFPAGGKILAGEQERQESQENLASRATDSTVLPLQTLRQVKAAGPVRDVKLGPRAVAQQPSEAEWSEAAVWEVELPEGASREAVLEVAYLGDVARVYVDDVPVADDFYKGLPLRCALWRIPQGRITVRILPWGDSPLIYVEPPFRPQETGAKLLSAQLVPREQK